MAATWPCHCVLCPTGLVTSDPVPSSSVKSLSSLQQGPPCSTSALGKVVLLSHPAEAAGLGRPFVGTIKSQNSHSVPKSGFPVAEPEWFPHPCHLWKRWCDSARVAHRQLEAQRLWGSVGHIEQSFLCSAPSKCHCFQHFPLEQRSLCREQILHTLCWISWRMLAGCTGVCTVEEGTPILRAAGCGSSPLTLGACVSTPHWLCRPWRSHMPPGTLLSLAK